jgi:hypothetical protein
VVVIFWYLHRKYHKPSHMHTVQTDYLLQKRQSVSCK